MKRAVDTREKNESMQVIEVSGQNLLLEKEKNKHVEHSVSFSEVESIGASLNLIAMYHRYSSADLSALLVKGISKQATIERLAERLGRPPFSLPDQEGLLLARYLVEDNKHKRIVLDLNASAPLPMVRCILEKIVGRVSLRPLEDTRLIWEELRMVPC